MMGVGMPEFVLPNSTAALAPHRQVSRLPPRFPLRPSLSVNETGKVVDELQLFDNQDKL